MIEELEMPFCTDDYGVGGPSFAELVDKINELVEAVNRMEKQIEKLQVL